jgi:hypothetical protein
METEDLLPGNKIGAGEGFILSHPEHYIVVGGDLAMPDDQVSHRIAKAIETVRQTYPRRIIAENGRQMRENLEGYVSHTLYPQLRRQFPDTDAVMLSVVGLMAYLGPDGAGFPPSSLCHELSDHVANYTGTLSLPERLERIVQLALAYGCGWGRTEECRSGVARWDGRWPGAVQDLVEAASHLVLQTVKILVDTVRNFPPIWQQDRTQIQEDAEAIVAEFIGRKPESTGARYKRYQLIQEWDPTTGNLYGFLKRAIRGGGNQHGRLQPNWFRTGLLFTVLKEREQINIGNVAFQKCKQHAHVTEYNGGVCVQCGGATFLFYKTLLIVPGVYIGREFWHCPNHEYDWQQTPFCPSCGHPRPGNPAWQCDCPKQRNWLDLVTVCPDCSCKKPEQIIWTCKNHYYQFTARQCPECHASRPKRFTWLWVQSS